MGIDGWNYQNHVARPTLAPHETVDTQPIHSGTIWKGDNIVFLARWTSDWDCDYKTNWWYCIKDTPFDINELNAKKRYEIKKGEKNFISQKIEDPQKYCNELLEVTLKSYSGWPVQYRPKVDAKRFLMSLRGWDSLDVFGAFSRNTGQLCGYAYLRDHGNYIEFPVIRTDPSYEKQGVNATLIASILDYYNGRLHDGFYISDGERTILHET